MRAGTVFCFLQLLFAVLVHAAYDIRQTRRAGIADGHGYAERRFEIRRTSEALKVFLAVGDGVNPSVRACDLFCREVEGLRQK